MPTQINSKTKKQIIEKIKTLCFPAGGCTEIGGIGYCVAAAAQKYKGNIKTAKHIIVEVSPYIFKNVLKVGVPNLGVCGITMIAAAGAAIANTKHKLELMSYLTPKQIETAKWLSDNKIVVIKIRFKCNPVFVKTTIIGKNQEIVSLVEKQHDNLASIRVNGEFVHSAKTIGSKAKQKLNHLLIEDLTFEEIINSVNLFTERELSFLEKLFEMNRKISEYGKQNMIPGSYTEYYSKSLKSKHTLQEQIMLDVAAAINARMEGVVMPVMTSCGSGDHGLTASIPQTTYHNYMKNDRLTYLRALLLVNMLVWKIKYTIGNLSCICGSVVAATTASIGSIAYQMKLSTKTICSVMESMFCSFNMAICDGAKSSCTQKITNAMLVGLQLLDMAKKGYVTKPLDGIVSGDINKTLKSFGRISKTNSNRFNLSVVNAIGRYGHTKI